MNHFPKRVWAALVGVAVALSAQAQVIRIDMLSPANESSVTLAPGGVQARATATVVPAGGIGGITLTSGGGGYTSAPTVVISGTGSGAIASATLGTGLQADQVVGVNITNPGSGYVGTPTVSFTGGGGGSGAAATVTLTPGAVTAITMTSFGGGYITAPGVTITGGGGSGAAATANVSNGLVTGITVTSPGSGYISPPTVTLDAPPGVVVMRARVSGTDSAYTTQFFVNGSAVSDPITHNSSIIPTAAWTPPQPGSYFITAKTADGLGNSATSLPVRIFVTGATVLSPIGNTLVPLGSSVVISGDATFAQGFIRNVEFFVNGTSIGVDSTAPYSIPYTPPGTGSYSITVRGTDNNGNQVTSVPTLIQVVNPVGAPPSTQIVNPVNGSSVAAGKLVDILIRADDADGFITKVETYLNGVLLNTDTSFPFQATWTPAVPGRYFFVALAFDDKGNVAASTPTEVNVTGGFPTVALTSPASGGTTVIQGTKLSVAVSAAGSDGGITSLRKIEFLVDGNVNDSLPKNPLGQDPPPPLTQPFEFLWHSNVALGTHRLAARVTDANGLTITSAEVPVVVIANQLPTVSIASPPAGANLPLNSPTTIVASVADPDGSVATVEFFVAGVSIGAADGPPWSIAWTPTAFGPYELTAKVTDNAGASVTSAPVTITVDPPTSTGTGGPSISNTVYRGDFGSATEAGRFAFAVNRNNRGTFIGFSAPTTASPRGVTYFWTDIPVNPDGVFTVRDASGQIVLSGQTSATGVSGTFGSRTFIGAVTPPSQTFNPTLVSGALTGVPNSQAVAIVGGDGSITLYVAQGSNREAGTSTLTPSGTFSFTPITGGTFSGNFANNAGIVSGTVGGTVSGGFLLRPLPSRIANISTRSLSGVGDTTMVAGFVISGTGAKPLLIRAVGPTLQNFGVNNALANPSLAVVAGANVVGANDDWGNSAALANLANQVGAFPLTAGSRDAAVQVSVQPGVYSALVGGGSTPPAAALVEIYDADPNPAATARITNISTRGSLAAGDAMIAGFVVTGDQRKRLLIRAVGPTLTTLGVPGALADPRIEVVTGTTTIASNNDWTETPGVSTINQVSPVVGAFPLNGGSRDSALVVQVAPGTYSVLVTSAVGSASGTVLLEIYDADL